MRIAQRYVDRYAKLCQQATGSKAQERYARAQKKMIEELSAAEDRVRVLTEAINKVWEVASGECQVAMDDTQGMEWISDYLSSIEDIAESVSALATPAPEQPARGSAGEHMSEQKTLSLTVVVEDRTHNLSLEVLITVPEYVVYGPGAVTLDELALKRALDWFIADQGLDEPPPPA